jgi:hypothetical protein
VKALICDSGFLAYINLNGFFQEIGYGHSILDKILEEGIKENRIKLSFDVKDISEKAFLTTYKK